MEKNYQVCTHCVMDTSDPHISFDENGVCDLCNTYEHTIKKEFDFEKSKLELDKIISKIKEDGKNRDFDCLLGMSGGADSSYMLHLAVKEFGLRPLVFHVDGGWNSELAVSNIQCMIDKLGLDLYTEVINWEEMKDFQLALFKSGTPYLDIAQDHAFVGTLYNYASKYNIRYILNGYNLATENTPNPLKYYYYGTDMRFINDIRRQFCTNPLKTYPFSSVFRHKIYLRYIKKVHVMQLLTYLPFNLEEVKKTLAVEYGWKPYPRKHWESRFTKFFESYWLYERFGFDVRRVQFSSLINSGQMTREKALAELAKKPYDEDTIKDDFKYIATKLGISTDELQGYFDMPLKFYWDYKNETDFINIGAKFAKSLGLYRRGYKR